MEILWLLNNMFNIASNVTGILAEGPLCRILRVKCIETVQYEASMYLLYLSMRPYYSCMVYDCTQAYSERCQTSNMNRFSKIINGQKLLTRTTQMFVYVCKSEIIYTNALISVLCFQDGLHIC